MITMTMTKDEAQYLLDAIDTHVKTHGLRVATGGVVLLAKLQGAFSAPEPEPEPMAGPEPDSVEGG